MYCSVVGSVYEYIFRPIRPSHLDILLHTAIYFVIATLRINIWPNGTTPILILWFQFVVSFVFIDCIPIRSIHKWNLSFKNSVVQMMHWVKVDSVIINICINMYINTYNAECYT